MKFYFTTPLLFYCLTLFCGLTASDFNSIIHSRTILDPVRVALFHDNSDMLKNALAQPGIQAHGLNNVLETLSIYDTLDDGSPNITPLSLAARQGHNGLIKILLAHGAEINYSPECDPGMTPLHYAAMYGHLSTCELLVDHGARVNAIRAAGEATPLFYAAKYLHPAICKLLLDHEADWTIQSYPHGVVTLNDTPASLGTMDTYHRTQMCLPADQVLDQASYEIENESRARAEIVALFAERGAYVGRTNPLCLAIRHHCSYDLCVQLLNAGARVDFDTRRRRPNGFLVRTPLMSAAASTGPDAPAIAQLLLDHGADIDAKVLVLNLDALKGALISHRDLRKPLEQIALLMHHGADTKHGDSAGWSAEDHGLHDKNKGEIQDFFEREKIFKSRCIDPRDTTTIQKIHDLFPVKLIRAAALAHFDQPTTIDIADIDTMGPVYPSTMTRQMVRESWGKYFNMALVYAVRAGNKDVIARLLAYGANPVHPTSFALKNPLVIAGALYTACPPTHVDHERRRSILHLLAADCALSATSFCLLSMHRLPGLPQLPQEVIAQEMFMKPYVRFGKEVVAALHTAFEERCVELRGKNGLYTT